MSEQVMATEPQARLAHLRARGQAAEVRPIELFFDLVYVLAVTQLTRQGRSGVTCPETG